MKKMLTMLAVGVMLFSLPVREVRAAFTNISFNTQSTDGILPVVSAFDWNSSGSGAVYLSNGSQYVPGTALSVGQVITFVYQSNLSAFNDGTNTPIGGLTKLNLSGAGGYELTAVATISEVVTGFGIIGTTAVATFQTLGGTAKIFYDNAVDSNVLAGTGFDNGTRILEGTIQAGTDTTFGFNLTNGVGQGATDIFAIVVPTFLNTSFFIAPPNLHDIDFTAEVKTPAIDSATNCFFCGPNGAPVGFNDIAANAANDFKVDGSNKFTVPEPGSLILLGSGLIGLAGLLRRKAKKVN